MSRNDSDTRRDVADELKWEPSLADDDIAVTVREGVVTLAGYVRSYFDKWRAERVAGRVKGVRGVANDVEVNLPDASKRADSDIARAAVDALRWNPLLPKDDVKVTVEDAWVTLDGDVDWYYQREAAQRSLRYLSGVKGVTNLVTVRQRAVPAEVERDILRALKRTTPFDADRIAVEVEGHDAVLRGTVRSYLDFRDAERAARNAPGITGVRNELVIDPSMMATV